MRLPALLVALVLLTAAPLTAQGVASPSNAVGTQLSPAPATPPQPGPAPIGSGPSLSLRLAGGSTEPDSLGSALEIVLLMTVLSMAPAIVMTMTCFTRIVIVLSFLKRAMSMQELPPAMVVTGFALFMTVFVMKPVLTDMYEQAYVPYTQKEIGFEQAAEIAGGRIERFMLQQTRPDDVALILGLAKEPRPATPDDVPFHVAVPAFILSEVKTAFQMGFMLFLPFVVIDIVISAILVSMGMFTLPPVMVSTPLKLLLFVMVDGWNMVVVSLAQSFVSP